MKRLIFLIPLIIILSVNILNAQRIITQPGTIINSSGDYALGNGLICTEDAKDGVIINADNVTLDYRNYNIISNTSLYSYGTVINGDNVTVKNAKSIFGFNQGIRVNNSCEYEISNCGIDYCDESIVLAFSHNGKIDSNRIIDYKAIGIHIHKSNDNKITNNIIKNIGTDYCAIYLAFGASQNTVSYNELESNYEAIGLNQGADSNIFNFNKGKGGVYGFYVNESSSNIGQGNNIISRDGDAGVNSNDNNIQNSTTTAIMSEFDKHLPSSFQLNPNYPNPFNPTTTISYQLPEVSDVELSIYNITGQKVAILVSEEQPAGDYKYEWDASEFASGVYIYRLKAGEFIQTKKMFLLK